VLYWIGWSLALVIAKFFGRMKVTGRENVPKTGPVILAPNHVSYIDPPTAGSGIFRPVRFMAKIELFQVPVMGFLIRKVGAFPVRQHTADRAALRQALDLLEKGEVVCVFPEGQRNLSDEQFLPAQPGLGMIALKSRAPVVPVALVNTNKLLRPHSAFFHFTRVRVIYGKPMTFDDLYEGGMGREAIDEVGKRVMEAIAGLMEGVE
jgi:1-acyl-sn-glycerol-3-phosphate acyltransferase